MEETKSKVKFEFNPDGSLQVPQRIIISKKESRKQLEEAEKNVNKVIVNFEEIQSGYEDEWTITLPFLIPKEKLYLIKKWTDKQHEISYGSAWITEKNRSEFVLNVKGRKNRHTWAHTFLNALNTLLTKEFKTKVKLNSTCKCDFNVK